MRCDYLIPNFNLDFDTVNDRECILKEGHKGDHVTQCDALKNERRVYLQWRYDHECTACDEAGEECECCVSSEISEAQARRLVRASHKKK